MKLSIILVNYKTKNLLQNCIKSIKSKYSYEIIVLNNSPEENLVSIRKINHRVKIIENKENIGFAKACNKGVDKAKGEYVMLLGTDTIILNNSIDKLILFLEKNKDYCVVSPQLLNKDKTIQNSLREFPTLHNVFMEFIKRGSYKIDIKFHERSKEVIQPQATCILIRKELPEIYGLFDERFPLYFNDVDFFKKLSVNHIKTYYLVSAKVIHLYGKSTKTLNSIQRHYLLYTGYFRYIRKWGAS
ncbi:glycosyltransferase family 2 protein [Patescibacteria group bacterium]|nr:glycosyltransferase family 2 protein [Patescibacteria group bacterium]